MPVDFVQLESWDGYLGGVAVPLGTNQQWSASAVVDPPLVGTTHGRRGTAAARLLTWQQNISRLLPAPATRLAVGFALRFTAYPDAWDGFSEFDEYPNILQLEHGDNTAASQLTLQITNSGAVRVTQGNHAAVLGTSVAELDLSTWHYLECEAVIHATAGSVVVYLDGTAILTLTNTDTDHLGTGVVTRVRLGNTSGLAGNSPLDIDDWALRVGSDVEAWGDHEIFAGVARANGIATDWAPNTGANWAAVDDVPPDGDTTYVATTADTGGAFDLYLPTLPSGAVLSLDAVQVRVVARAEGAGTATIQPCIRSSGATVQGTAVILPTTYGYYATGWPTNPLLGAAWTPQQLAQLQIGAYGS